MKEITKGNKLIAEYLEWKYVASNDLGNFKRAGWYCKPPKGLPILSPKQGFPYNVDGQFYKYVCRNHNNLRFYNSFDALIPVIEKLENDNFEFTLQVKGAFCLSLNPDNDFYYKSFREELSWIQNTFMVVVETIENTNERNL